MAWTSWDEKCESFKGRLALPGDVSITIEFSFTVRATNGLRG